MKIFYSNVIKHSKKILIIFGLLFLLGLFCKPLVKVNYDINKYLPKDSASTIALDVMGEEFNGAIPNTRVMIHDISIAEAIEYKQKMLEIDGVTDVVWLDDVIDINTPIEIADSDVVNTYYKQNNALYTVTIDDNKRIEATQAVQDLIGQDNSMTGSAVATALAMKSTVADISKIAVAAILFVLFVLIVTTTSWFEPFLILAGIIVAVVLNAGSNLIFGEISFLTNTAGSILQIAVSLDYSVFLIHRFEECRSEISSPKEAMAVALCKSTSSILSSGLTTVIGFLALILMQFLIGRDLGLALAKGIAISLIVVFIFMPPLILATYKLLDKTKHPYFLPQFKRFGKAVTYIMLPMVCIFVIVLVPSFLASNANSFYYGSSHIFNEKTKYGADTNEIEKIFGKDSTFVILVPKGTPSVEKELSNALHEIPQVTSVISYVDKAGVEIPEAYIDTDICSKLESDRYSRMVVSASSDSEGDHTFGLVEKLRNTAQTYYPNNYHLAGESVSTYDLMSTITKDMIKVNLIAIGAVFVVLLITMKSISLPIILVLSIETAIWINFSIPYFQDTSIFYIAYLIISSVQLGATVDYAILFTERYKEIRGELPRKKAIIKTVSKVTASILTSGCVLTVVGFLLGFLSTHGLISQLGFFLGKGTICSMVIVFFVLPGLLYLFDGLIRHTTKGINFIKD